MVEVLKKEGAFHKLARGPRTLGEKAADKLAEWAGSWAFILGFLVFLGLWMATNVYAWTNSWDPYPFILLNLVLSCVAALQAPVILMSQNRQTQKDRQKADYDYRVNRKSERGIERILVKVEAIEAKLASRKIVKRKTSL